MVGLRSLQIQVRYLLFDKVLSVLLSHTNPPHTSFGIDLNQPTQPDTSLLLLFEGESGLLEHPKYSITQINTNQAVLNLPNDFAEKSITLEGKLFGEQFERVTPYMCTYEQLVRFMVEEPESRNGTSN